MSTSPKVTTRGLALYVEHRHRVSVAFPSPLRADFYTELSLGLTEDAMHVFSLQRQVDPAIALTLHRSELPLLFAAMRELEAAYTAASHGTVQRLVLSPELCQAVERAS